MRLTLMYRLQIAFEVLFTCRWEKELPVFQRGYVAGHRDGRHRILGNL
jgi:hypothetical protein